MLFFVDEVGQFIGNNTQRMLKLQTITENLGTICEGRAWVVVTSQEDIDAVIGQMSGSKGNDFSKIQGRFERLSLSSSNTSEVIEKRLLEKDEQARDELQSLYDQKGDILRNQLAFDGTTTSELANYKDATSFVHAYPFVPYHYILVQKIFEAIRKAGATGLHLSRGERSLLDAFQSAAQQISNEEVGALIPLYRFYPAIESFLDTSVKRDIEQASEKDAISDFTVEILKTLFLIRYVDAIKSTLDNLVTLSVSKVDEDRLTLRHKIEVSLNVLEQNLLIARQGDEYIFLTNEEKEIEKEIQHTEIEVSDETAELSNIIFDEVLRRKNQYTYPVNNQLFPVSRFCNGVPRDGAVENDLVLKVISPIDANYAEYIHTVCLNNSAEGNGAILVKLEDDKQLFDELRTFIKNRKFLRMTGGNRPEQEQLLRDKSSENHSRHKRIINSVEELLKDAHYFALGSQLNPKGSSVSVILDDAYRYVIENTFSKLKLVRRFPGDIRREIQQTLVADDASQIGLDLKAEEANPEATLEVEKYITLADETGRVTTAEDVVKRFSKRPYGWNDEEILLIMARLALANKICFQMRQQDVPLKNVYDNLSQIRKRTELRVRKIKQQSETNLKRAAKLYRDVFMVNAPDTEKELFNVAQDKLRSMKTKLDGFAQKSSTGQYPGKNEIEHGRVLLAGLIETQSSFQFIDNFLAASNELLDFEEDFEDLENFYETQFNTWQRLARALSVEFERNRKALEGDEQAAKALSQLEAIYNKDRPYREIRNIEPLIEQVDKVNTQLLDKKREHARERITHRISLVQNQIKQAHAPQELSNRVLMPLQNSIKRLEKQQAIADILQEQTESQVLEEDAYIAINDFIEEQEATRKQQEPNYPTKGEKVDDKGERKVDDKPIPPPPKKMVTLDTSAIIRKVNDIGIIETEEDIENYLGELRTEMMALIKGNNKVRIR